MKRIYLIYGIMSILILSSCERDLGLWVTVPIDLTRFHQIRQDANVDILIRQGPSWSIVFEGYDDVLADLDFSVIQGKLIIRQFGHFGASGRSTVYIIAPDISLLEITASGDITIPDRFVPQGDLELSIRGSGDLDLNVDVPELWTTCYGSGDLRLRGYADFHTIEHDGSGWLDAFYLRTEGTRIEQSGSGRSELHAVRQLFVRLRGTGDIFFIGYPYLDSRLSGSGRLIDAN
jgi:hypothetical protein